MDYRNQVPENGKWGRVILFIYNALSANFSIEELK